MSITAKSIALLAALALALHAQDISASRIRTQVKFLSSDYFTGRGPGSRGGEMAAEYIATQFALAGLKPAGDQETYLQAVPLVGVMTLPQASLSAVKGGLSIEFERLDEWIGDNQRQTAAGSFEGEAVFVGHGIVAPEFQWNDYKDADVRGKVVVLFTNEPASDDPKFFGGRALTYYGRWTYKYEQALRQGALGAVIIHTTPTAGYGWDVLRGSGAREQLSVMLTPGAPALAFAGWLSTEAGEKLLSLAGRQVEELLKASESRDFRPIPLGVSIRGNLPSRTREVRTHNVVGVVPGSDPALASEAVVFTAHWDHLGIGVPVAGDTIYNGAVDNATGCGIVLEMARAWAALPKKPRRSAVFLAVTSEEAGLLGSNYYGLHPAFPAGKTALNINYDQILPLGRTTDVVVVGAERTTAWPVVQNVARRMNLAISPDPHPEQGEYYRSDHFSLAHVGIPAFSVSQGTHFAGKPADFGIQAFEVFNALHYHQPSDEFHEDWDFSGLAELARFGFQIGIEVASQGRLPTWHAGDEFLAAREKSGVK